MFKRAWIRRESDCDESAGKGSSECDARGLTGMGVYPGIDIRDPTDGISGKVVWRDALWEGEPISAELDVALGDLERSWDGDISVEGDRMYGLEARGIAGQQPFGLRLESRSWQSSDSWATPIGWTWCDL